MTLLSIHRTRRDEKTYAAIVRREAERGFRVFFVAEYSNILFINLNNREFLVHKCEQDANCWYEILKMKE